MSFKFFGYAFKLIPRIIHECSVLNGMKKNIDKMIKTLESPEKYVFTVALNAVFHFRVISNSISSAKTAF